MQQQSRMSRTSSAKVHRYALVLYTVRKRITRPRSVGGRCRETKDQSISQLLHFLLSAMGTRWVPAEANVPYSAIYLATGAAGPLSRRKAAAAR